MPQQTSTSKPTRSRSALWGHLRRVLGTTAVVVVAISTIRGCSQTRVSTSLVGGAPLSSNITLPTEMCGWYFIAEVYVNGAGPFQMMLDTGMQRTQITPAVAEAADVNGAIDTLRFGALDVEGHITCRVRSLDVIGRALGRRIDGIVAHDVFADVLLTYDYPNESVRAAGGQLDAGAPGVVGSGSSRRPMIRSTVDDRTIDVLIDTGSSGGLTLQSLDSYAFTAGPTITGTRTRLDGVHHIYSGRLQRDVRLGPVTLNTPIARNSVSVNLVGQVHLRHFVLTFDQRRDLCHFGTTGGRLPDRLTSDPIIGMGVSMRPVASGLEVTAILQAGPAESTDLKVGDIVTAVNGVSVLDRGCKERSTQPSQPKPIVLTIVRNEATLDIEVEEAVLVR